MATIIDSYSETNSSTDNGIDSSGVLARGQSFTGNGMILDSCKFYLKKYGSPTGNIMAKLYAHTGTFGTDGKPTGAVLATSDNFDISTLTTSLALITFNFTGANRINLANGTHYCIIVEFTGGNYSNQLRVGADNSSPSHSGNQCYYISSWGGNNNYDNCFYVYGDWRKIECETGSFTLTGQDTNLRLDRKLICSVGNFALTGIDVGLSYGRRLLCECGNFALTGKDVGLKMTRKIVCSVGSFALTGKDVLLSKGYHLLCEVGRFIFTGIDVRLKKSMRNKSKVSTSFTNKSKNSTSFTNRAKVSTSFTNKS